jgi:hypothetical protein
VVSESSRCFRIALRASWPSAVNRLAFVVEGPLGSLAADDGLHQRPARRSAPSSSSMVVRECRAPASEKPRAQAGPAAAEGGDGLDTAERRAGEGISYFARIVAQPWQIRTPCTTRPCHPIQGDARNGGQGRQGSGRGGRLHPASTRADPGRPHGRRCLAAPASGPVAGREDVRRYRVDCRSSAPTQSGGGAGSRFAGVQCSEPSRSTCSCPCSGAGASVP